MPNNRYLSVYLNAAEKGVRYQVTEAEKYALDEVWLFEEKEALSQAVHSAKQHGLDEWMMRGTLVLSPYLQRNGESEQAYTFLEWSSQNLPDNVDQEHRAVLYDQLGQAAESLGDYTGAAAQWRVALSLSIPNSSQYIYLLIRLAIITCRLAEESLANQYVGQLQALVDRLKDQHIQCDVYDALAYVTFNTTSFTDAISLIEQAKAIAYRVEDTELIQHQLFAYSTYMGIIGDTPSALKTLTRAMQLTAGTENRRRVMIDSQRIGMLLANMGQFDEAKAKCEIAIKEARKQSHLRFLSVALRGRALLALLDYDYEYAGAAIDEALHFAHKMAQVQLISAIHNSQAIIALHAGGLGDATDYIQQGLRLSRQHHFQATICFTQITNGELSLLQGDVESAEAAFQESLHIAVQFGAFQYKAEAEFGLAKIALCRAQEVKALCFAHRSLAYCKNVQSYRVNQLQEWAGCVRNNQVTPQIPVPFRFL